MRDEKRVLVTDTTMRDAHQSLLATRMRTHDIAAAAEAYAKRPAAAPLARMLGRRHLRRRDALPLRRSVGAAGADPREACPNLLTQMLLRGANGVGYTNYPDNVVQLFRAPAPPTPASISSASSIASTGSRTCASRSTRCCEAGKLAEGAICYTGDMLDPDRAKYDLAYYVGIAKELERAGCHILGIKDMAGLLQAGRGAHAGQGAEATRSACRSISTPTTPRASPAATVLAAVEAGVDAVDAAMDSMSGITSQPCLGSHRRGAAPRRRATPGLDPERSARSQLLLGGGAHAIRRLRKRPQGAGTSEVYLHEMPGGQFTNLKEQARALGLETRWHEVAKAYRDANDLFGDIVKVTPSSKVVGDMALMMVSQDLTAADVLDPDKRDRLPGLGRRDAARRSRPAAGRLAEALQAKALKGETPIDGAARLAAAARRSRRRRASRPRKPAAASSSDDELASYLMYPKVFADFCRDACADYGPVSVLPTPVFFYGMQPGDEIAIEIERGKTLVVLLQTDRRDRRGGPGQGLLRAERPAAHHPRAEPVGGGDGDRAAQGRGGQRIPCRRADAGRDLDHRGAEGPAGQGRRRRSLTHRGDEDGDRAARRRATARWPRFWCRRDNRSTRGIC